MNICIVDDHKIFRQTMKMAISSMWNIAEVDEAEDGIDFIHKIKNGNEYDLVLMDMNMKKMSGIEATILALIKNPLLKVVAVTMDWKKEYVMAMQKAGAKGYIIKSSERMEFKMAFETILNGGIYFQGETY